MEVPLKIPVEQFGPMSARSCRHEWALCRTGQGGYSGARRGLCRTGLAPRNGQVVGSDDLFSPTASGQSPAVPGLFGGFTQTSTDALLPIFITK